MVWRTERRSDQQPASGQGDPGRRVHHRGLERQVGREVGQQARQTSGEHRLAGARRTDEQQVVAAGRGDLERQPGQRLPLDVGEVVQFGFDELGRGVGRLGPGDTTVEGLDELCETLDGSDHPASRCPCLGDRRGRNDPVVTRAARRPSGPRPAPPGSSRRAPARLRSPDLARHRPGSPRRRRAHRRRSRRRDRSPSCDDAAARG